MAECNSEDVYQFYTVIDDLEFDEPGQQDNTIDLIENNEQVVYVTVPSLAENEEQMEENLTPLFEDVSDNSLSMYNIKLVTLPDGQVFITTDALDDNLTAIHRQLLSVSQEPSTSVDDLEDVEAIQQSIEEDNLTAIHPQLLSVSEEPSTSFVDALEVVEAVQQNIEDYREVKLTDGTTALIDSNLLKLLKEETNVSLEETNTHKARPKGNYFCTYDGCFKSFTSSHHLSVHVRSHTGSRPYCCNIEGCYKKTFVSSYSLKAHIRTHTGEKPYGCAVCNKHFKTSGDLQKHIRTHTGEKPFKCPIEGCNKSFSTSNIRKVHIRSHTGERPYVCTISDCGKAFSSATNYKNHIRIHSGEKPYWCAVEGCGKRFTEYSSLYKHKAVHAPVKLFQCSDDGCQQIFKSEALLKQHIKKMHGVVYVKQSQILIDLK